AARLAAAIEDLFPGYFALVMATGIVSIATELRGWHGLAVLLLAINVVAYLILATMLCARFAGYFPRVRAVLRDLGRGPGFFPIVAAPCVLGAQLLVVAGAAAPARALWFVGVGLWAVVMYGFFTAVVIRTPKPT